jgi:hypothetical protein
MGLCVFEGFIEGVQVGEAGVDLAEVEVQRGLEGLRFGDFGVGFGEPGLGGLALGGCGLGPLGLDEDDGVGVGELGFLGEGDGLRRTPATWDVSTGWRGRLMGG